MTPASNPGCTIGVEVPPAAHPAAAGNAAPACAGIIVSADDRANAIGAVAGGNPLDPAWRAPEEPPGTMLVAWSGTLAADLFEPDPRNWMAAGYEALTAWCAAALPTLSTGGRVVCLHPHARHVLNDAMSCVKFLDDHADDAVEVALAPASLFEPSMIDDAEDHLERMFAMLGPRTRRLRLADVVVDEAAGRCRAVPLGEGCLPPATVRRLVHGWIGPESTVVLPAEGVDRQRAWLGV